MVRDCFPEYLYRLESTEEYLERLMGPGTKVEKLMDVPAECVSMSGLPTQPQPVRIVDNAAVAQTFIDAVDITDQQGRVIVKMSCEPSGPCTACGSPDHWRPDCPRLEALHFLAKDIREIEGDQPSATDLAEKLIKRGWLKAHPPADLQAALKRGITGAIGLCDATASWETILGVIRGHEKRWTECQAALAATESKLKAHYFGMKCFACGVEWKEDIANESCDMSHREHWAHEWVRQRERDLTKRVVELQQRAEAAETRVAEAAKKLEAIVCVAEPDRGVVLLSYDGPTHCDPAAKCQVYDHQNFSPLGDALIELHDLLSVKP